MFTYISYILHTFIQLITGFTKHGTLMMALTKHQQEQSKPTSCKFDKDSVKIAIDNCSSYCRTPNMQDFIEPPGACNIPISGLGDVQVKKIGTVKWSILDDDGCKHTFQIPGVLYIETIPYHIWSPQHWSQTLPKGSAECVTTADMVTLKWEHHKYTRTIPLCKQSNIALLRTAPSFKKYYQF